MTNALLILDEATSGLDPVVRDDILDMLLDFVQDEEHSILVSSHLYLVPDCGKGISKTGYSLTDIK